MIQATDMEGVFLTPLRIETDDRGSVMKMMDIRSIIGGKVKKFAEIEEIYFSTINARVVKGWHGHKEMTLNYACILGSVMVGLCDMRVGKTFGQTAEVVLHDTAVGYKLLTIPPGVWNGIKSYRDRSIIANAATLAYSMFDIERIHPKDFPIPFDWGEYDIAG
jgi:dTDP-4-dehydrorhamnose 3,5-epimerase